MNLWLRRFHPDATGDTTLVRFPQVGGSASFCSPMSAALRTVVSEVAVQLALRSNYAAVRSYQPGPVQRLACDIVALVGSDDPKVDADEAAAWRDHTTATARVLTFPASTSP